MRTNLYRASFIIIFMLFSFKLYGEEQKTAQKVLSVCTSSSLKELAEIRRKKFVEINEVEDREVQNDIIHFSAFASLHPSSQKYDIERALCFFEFLIEDNHLMSLNELIRIYALNEKYLDKDRAKELAIKGSHLKDAESQYYLYILMKDNEKHLNKDRYYWLLEAHLKGFAPATCTLATKWKDEGRYAESVKLFQEGARKYNRSCMFRLAIAHVNGKGVVKSDCIGFEWAKKADALGSKNAKRLLKDESKRFKKCDQPRVNHH